MSNHLRFARFAALAIAAAAVAACSDDAAKDGAHAHAPGALPAPFALASAPAGAKSVKDVVASAKSGDEVVVSGRVGMEGSDSAFFTLVDGSLKSCVETGDECKTPWDFCCTPPDEMAKVSATIVFQAGAKPIAGSVIGFQGLDHLSNVVVKGKAEKDSAGNLTVVADGIFVRK